MICTICDRNLTLCICDNADERIERLKDSPYLQFDWEAIKAARLLARYEIELARQEAKGNKAI